ncbi:MAG: ABC transporter permease [Firmicutes bacterium]|jgi:peptide/nickel transport system permease protein|nr:ABC transporter permease [Bacillota bacterium]
MGRYVVRRLVGAIPVFVGVIVVVFILTTLVPGDPARIMAGQAGNPETIARIRKEMGLDDPLLVQMWNFFKSAVTFNLGRSYRNNMDVNQAILSRFPATIKLALAGMVIAIVLGMTSGIISAVKQYSVLDYTSMFVALVGISAPSFWIGLLFIYLFCVTLRWIPGTGTGNGEFVYLILPALTLGIRPAALIARMTRSSMLEVIRQDYIRTAWAKGLGARVVVLKHALKNAMIPVVTIVGVQMASLLSGVVLIEQVFQWPGVGRLFVEALTYRDFPIIRGEVLFLAGLFIISNLLVDLSYALFDPRIRYD